MPTETATLYRDEDAIVIEGASGWSRRIELAEVAVEEAYQHTLASLQQERWMTLNLREQFEAEVLWLREQLLPGK